MDRMIVTVFDNESKAYEGVKALGMLDFVGSISLHAGAVIKKNTDGKVTIVETVGDIPVHTVGGTALGSLIGILGGPIGFAIGATTGTMVGSIADLNHAGVNVDFLNEASAKLTPGKWAVVADVSEEEVTPLDTKMEALGGTVFRASRWFIEDEQDQKYVAMLKGEIAEMKAEIAVSKAEDKAKLQAKLDALEKKLQTKLDNAKMKAEQRKKEAQAKVQALKEKASKAKGDVKAKIEKRIAEIKESDYLATKEFDEWFARYRGYVE
jgi:uncharacterized membrane protein